MRGADESDKREVGRRAMQEMEGRKKGLHPKMEPYESGGKRTREEDTPFADEPDRGRRIRSKLSVVGLRDRGRRMRCGVSATT